MGLWSWGLSAQVTDSLRLPTDSVIIDTTSTLQDKTNRPPVESPLSRSGGSENSLRPTDNNSSEKANNGSDPVESGSKDSSWMDNVNQELHLWGAAFVKYTDYEIKGDHIVINFKSNDVTASRNEDAKERVEFTSGDQNVSADRLVFNIDSQKGIVYGANIRQNNLYIHGAITKFVRAGKDSLHIDDVIYNRNALITTCDLDHPHWGIRTTKLKFIPDKLAVMGPANLELAGIPTPLMFPFAFAPLMNFNNASSGIISPQEFFDVTTNRGIGVRGLGYYLALSEYADLSVRGDIYTRGSWSIATNTNYKKRYKHTGSVNLSFSKQFTDVAGQLDPDVQNSYSISINHNQDTKAHPYRKIGGSLRFTVNDFDRRNFTDANSQLNSQINSNFSYNYKLSDIWNFSSAITHSQNTLNRSISFTLPDLQMRMNRTFPFKSRRGSLNNEKWFEKISLQYNGRFQNSVSTVDTLLFTQETLDDFRAGFTHEFDVGASYNLFEHFSFNTNFGYDEFWYLQSHELVRDSSGTIDSRIVQDFKPLRSLTTSANVTTNIFGTIQFKKGWLRGLRHQIRPSVGLSYTPSTEGYYEYFDFDPNISIDEQIRYNPFSPDNPFDNADNEKLFRSSSLASGGMSVTYGLNNTFEGKYYSKKDSTEKKFKIFNSVNLSGTYNLQADSLNWSTISLSANAQLIKNITQLSISGTLDPYIETSSGRINTTVWSDSKSLARLDRLSISLATRFSLSDIRDFIQNKGQEPKIKSRRGAVSRESTLYPEFFSWFDNAQIQHIFRFGYDDNRGVKSWETMTHSIQLTTGNIPLSDKWGMSVGNLSYDLKNQSWVYPSFTLNRDLHCWRMSISWQPQADTYSFFIGVKASPFSEFLKYQTGRDVFDSSFIN